MPTTRSAPPKAPPSGVPRVAFITIGQAPRDDIVPELLAMLELGPGDLAIEQFGALDGLDAAAIAEHPPALRERSLYTRLTDGSHVVVGSGFVTRRLDTLLKRVDDAGFDLLVLITTGIFRPLRLRTRLVNGQEVVDAWIAALVMGDCQLGLIYPLQSQQELAFEHGTLIQNSRAVAATGDTALLEEAAARLDKAELILMHSVGYTEAMTRRIAALTQKPVVSARRIIAGAVRLHLTAWAGRAAPIADSAEAAEGAALIDRLPKPADPLTPRERDVLAGVLSGEANKAIGRKLGISHRTVEIHRSRAMTKLNATSVAELMRRVLISR